MGLDLYIVMMEGVMELLHSARNWYVGGEEDIKKLNLIVDTYVSNYVSTLMESFETPTAEDEVGDLGETLHS